MAFIARFRSGGSLNQQSAALGPLAGLVGEWAGTGFVLTSLPDFDSRPPSTGPKPFRLLLNSTIERLELMPIGGPVPNRGAELSSDAKGQDDIELQGLRYLQRISDANSHEALHLEPGFWLNVPATNVPPGAAGIVRAASIPHGVSILVQGTAISSPTGKPVFAVADSTPQKNPPTLPPLGPGYLAPFTTQPLPPPLQDRAVIQNPNLLLADAIKEFLNDITSTMVLQVSSSPSGGVLNIPFLENPVNNNAAVKSVNATFWIEHVKPAAGRPFDVLQYSQTIIFNFLGINWPHITVATLFRL